MTGLAPCRQREGWREVEDCMAVRVDMMLTSWSPRSMLVGLQVDLDSCCAPLPCAVCRASLGGVLLGQVVVTRIGRAQCDCQSLVLCRGRIRNQQADGRTSWGDISTSPDDLNSRFEPEGQRRREEEDKTQALVHVRHYRLSKGLAADTHHHPWISLAPSRSGREH